MIDTALKGVFVLKESNTREVYAHVKTEVILYCMLLFALVLYPSNSEPLTLSMHKQLIDSDSCTFIIQIFVSLFSLCLNAHLWADVTSTGHDEMVSGDIFNFISLVSVQGIYFGALKTD